MVGLVVKNAILLITYAVQLIEEQGVERDRALILASERRMRPIFMTAVSMVLVCSASPQARRGRRNLQRPGYSGGGRSFRSHAVYLDFHSRGLHHLG